MTTLPIPEIYVEALGQVSASNGVLMLHFIGRRPEPDIKDTDNAPQVVKQRVVMPMTALPAAAQLLAQLLAQLEQQGVIKRVGEAGPVTVGSDGSVN